MSNLLRPTLIAATGAAAILGGVASAIAQPLPIPELRIEGPRPPTPGANYLWEPGHWQWADGHYVWVGGRWVAREPGWARAEWIPGHWRQRGAEWAWVPGHWE